MIITIPDLMQININVNDYKEHGIIMITMLTIINGDDFNDDVGGLTDLGRLCRCCQLEKGCPAKQQMIKRVDQYTDK